MFTQETAVSERAESCNIVGKRYETFAQEAAVSERGLSRKNTESGVEFMSFDPQYREIQVQKGSIHFNT